MIARRRREQILAEMLAHRALRVSWKKWDVGSLRVLDVTMQRLIAGGYAVAAGPNVATITEKGRDVARAALVSQTSRTRVEDEVTRLLKKLSRHKHTAIVVGDMRVTLNVVRNAQEQGLVEYKWGQLLLTPLGEEVANASV